MLDALATLRPSAHTDLVGPALPDSADVLAVLGATAPDALPALLARCPGTGHAVLLDVAGWGGPAGPPVPAAALRDAGWAVTVASRGDRPDAVWDELVACPAPRAGAS